jgi:hypothetical protein
LVASTLAVPEARAIRSILPTSTFCTWLVPDKVVSGDAWYGSENPNWLWCRKDFLKNLAEGYGMDKEDWDNGFGWSGACNTDAPFARLTTARVAMDVSSPFTQRGRIDRSFPFIEWALAWSFNVVEDLRCKCQGEDAIAFYQPTTFSIGDFIALNVTESGSWQRGYFFGQNVVQRAAILLHEATHWVGEEHVRRVFDQRYGRGAFTTEVMWLSDYATSAFNPARQLQCSAQDTANAILAESFIEDPGFSIKADGCPFTSLR